jgi:adenylylsulfate kinase-like enzyme
MVYLITGKAGAGKTYYANALKKELIEGNKTVHLIDGDVFRKRNVNTDFTNNGRIKNLIQAAEEAQEHENLNEIVILSFVAPMKEWRLLMRSHWQESQLIYIPGGTLWEGSIYQVPDKNEFEIFNKIMKGN